MLEGMACVTRSYRTKAHAFQTETCEPDDR
jgi:hypothetical protein